jgi:hypothetical protein
VGQAPAADPAQFGFSSADASLSSWQAGAHADLLVRLALETDPESETSPGGVKRPYGAVRDLRVQLPPGLIGASGSFGPSQQCEAEQLLAPGGSCPNDSQVGLLEVGAYDLDTPLTVPVFMMRPPGGDALARLGMIAGVFPAFLDVVARAESSYGMAISLDDASSAGQLVSVTMTIWGVPSDPSHDTERCTPTEAVLGCVTSPPRPPGSHLPPLLTNPTRCGIPLELSATVSSWEEPDRSDRATAPMGQISGCDRIGFAPGLSVQPTTARAGAPSGLDLRLRLAGPDGPGVPEPSQLRALHLELPSGMSLAPAAANGLEACSNEQVGLGLEAPAHCPNASRIGDAEFIVPALSERLHGGIFLRGPEPGQRYGFWLVIDDGGLRAKLPGRLDVDPADGQLESALLELPQIPLREALISFRAGARAPFTNPPSCGVHAARYSLRPWAGAPPFAGISDISIDQGCDGPTFSPSLSAGSTNAAAGAFSPFFVTISARDGEPALRSLEFSLPPGLSGALGALPNCPEPLTTTGDCPESSRVGSLAVAVGRGAEPLWLPRPGWSPGGVYLAGPYRRAPFSLLLALPVQAGPFDLGTVAVRAAVSIDPRTAQATIRSDPLPRALEGIPIDYRTIHISLDRPGFIRNPTSCEPSRITATATSTEGTLANLSSPFRAVDCAALAFRPKLSLRLSGGLGRNAHPQIDIDLIPRAAEANLAAATFTLPAGELLDFHRIRVLCARGLAPEQCPRDARLGYARLFSPLLSEALQGPIHLRAPSHRFPDLVTELRGGGIHVLLHGHTAAAPGGRLRVRFSGLPDLPLTRASITLAGGRSGIFVNSDALCARPRHAAASLSAHSGKQLRLRPKVSLRGRC